MRARMTHCTSRHYLSTSITYLVLYMPRSLARRKQSNSCLILIFMIILFIECGLCLFAKRLPDVFFCWISLCIKQPTIYMRFKSPASSASDVRFSWMFWGENCAPFTWYAISQPTDSPFVAYASLVQPKTKPCKRRSTCNKLFSAVRLRKRGFKTNWLVMRQQLAQWRTVRRLKPSCVSSKPR